MLSIRARRNRLGMSQAELAERIGVNQTAVSQWERGVITPTLNKARKLAETLGCTIDELYADEPEKEAG